MEKKLIRELQKSNKKITIWWRDDDVEKISKDLIDYYSAIYHYCIVISSVIPSKFYGSKNKKKLKKYNNIIFCAHGTKHINYENFKRKRSEFGLSRDKKDIIEDLIYSFEFLNDNFNEDIKIFVPPWNKISKKSSILAYEIGFNIISTSSKNCNDIYFNGDLNINVDLINWKDNMKLLTYNEVLNKIYELCIINKNKNNIEIGIMSHFSVNHNSLLKLTKRLIKFFLENNKYFKGLLKIDLEKIKDKNDFTRYKY